MYSLIIKKCSFLSVVMLLAIILCFLLVELHQLLDKQHIAAFGFFICCGSFNLLPGNSHLL